MSGKTQYYFFFIECLATKIVETYEHMVGISKEQEKQCLQK